MWDIYRLSEEIKKRGRERKVGGCTQEMTHPVACVAANFPSLPSTLLYTARKESRARFIRGMKIAEYKGASLIERREESGQAIKLN